MGYSAQAFKGFSWMGVLRFSTRLIAFLRLAILARILTPQQFGVFGIATLLLAFLEVITETGINVFLIQRKEDINQYIDSAWIISIVRGVLVSLLILVSAPFVVRFFNSPESLSVILLISLVPIIRGFINPSIIKIQKDIQFHKEFYIRFMLLTVDAVVVIIAALIFRNAESFALGLIVTAVIEVILSFVFFKPIPRVHINVGQSIFILRRGFWVTLTGIFAYFADYGDKVVIGRVLSTSSLGIYQVAYRISTLPITEITETVNRVTFPVYSKFSEDKNRVIKAFYKVTLTSSAIAIVLGLIIFIFAEQIVYVLLGSGWELAIPIVKILSFYGILRTIFGNFSALFLSLEKQNYVAKTTLVRVTGLFIVILPLISKYGLSGAAYAAIISIILEIPVIIYYFSKIKKS